MSYALSTGLKSVDNLEFNALTCNIVTASVGAAITISSTPSMTGVSKDASNRLVLASGASYYIECSLNIYDGSVQTTAEIQWWNNTDSAYIGQPSRITNRDWFAAYARVNRFVTRALILSGDFGGASLTLWPRVISTSGGSLGLSGYTTPVIRVWRIS